MDRRKKRRYAMKSGARRLFLSTVMAAAMVSVAFASGATWSLDSNSSSARFFQGSKANPDSLNPGVARVTGNVKLDTSDLENSVFDLSIYPADEDWGDALSPDGNLLTGYVLDSTDHTLLTFKSKRILRTEGSQLEVIGDLTLTRVERGAALTPTEVHAGRVHGIPVIHTIAKEITFQFPSLSAALLPGSLSPAVPQKEGALEVLGSGHVDYKTFPELLHAIKETNWPPVARNKECQMPLTVGRDYSGAMCTGSVLATTQDDNCYMPLTVADDYSGPVCSPAAGNQTTIVLHLKLLP
jgi:polyisoprenoid-binding protein YceI